jgi:cell division protein FtsB
MGRVYEHSNKSRRQFIVVFLLLFQFYFLFHLVFSERSVPSLVNLSTQESILNKKIASLYEEHAILQDNVVRLRPETLDQDMLNEQAMRILGTASDNSVILLDNNS